MTYLIDCGWESDRIYKKSVQMQFTTPSRPIVLTGFMFKAAMIPSDTQILEALASAQVLWWVRIDGLPGDPGGDWGTPTYQDATAGKQNLHGGGLANNIICCSIMKASPWFHAVNEVLTTNGWKIQVPAKCKIMMHADHAGYGPIDFEIQGGLYYE